MHLRYYMHSIILRMLLTHVTCITSIACVNNRPWLYEEIAFVRFSKNDTRWNSCEGKGQLISMGAAASQVKYVYLHSEGKGKL